MRILEEDFLNLKKVWVVERYSDRGGAGMQDYFDNFAEALVEARDEWNHLAEADKKNYLADGSHFWMSELTIVEKDGEYYPDFGNFNVLWDASEYEKKLGLRRAISDKRSYIEQLKEEIAIGLHDSDSQQEVRDEIADLEEEIKEIVEKLMRVK